MKQRAFEEQNEERWTEFEALVATLDRHGRKRPLGDVRDRLEAFPARYLEVCRDLAVATERRYSLRLLDRLNRLTLDGHRILYARDSNIALRAVRFFARDFPEAVRRDAASVALASALFLLPAALVAALIAVSPELVYSVLDPGQVQEFEEMYDPAAKVLGENRDASTDMAMFGFYIMNNIGIAFRAYAAGVAFGLGSALVLIMNGLTLGGVAAHLVGIGFATTFGSFVIGHGAFELTAIVLSGAAGLRLGWSLIAPGARTRIASLRRAAQETVTVVYGVFAMLVVAALLEAFWSSKGAIAPEIKFAVGGVLWALVLAYFAFAGRGSSAPSRVGAPDER